MDTERIKQLLAGYGSSDASTKQEAKRELIEHLEDQEVIILLEGILREGKMEHRREMVELLGGGTTPQAFQLLVLALSDPSDRVSFAAFDTLRGRKDEALDRYIGEYLERKDLDWSVRGELLSILLFHQRLNDPELLIQTLRYGTTDARLTSAGELGKIKTKEVYHALREAQKQEYHPDVLSSIRKSIDQFEADGRIFSSGDQVRFFTRLQESPDWFSDLVLYLRKLGFFLQFKELTDLELVQKLRRARPFLPEGKKFKMIDILETLAQDKERVWFEDLETFVKNEYVNLLKEWGAISCGKFLPEKITEIWDGPVGPIRVQFEHKGHPYEMTPGFYGDQIQLEMLSEVNIIIQNSGVQLCNAITDSQEACVIGLRAAEKKQLEEDLGIKFAFPARYPKAAG